MRPINPTNNNGSIQLKFSFSGKRYTFHPIPGGDYSSKRDLATARAIATKIQNDILAGNFDPTLDRYRLAPKISKANSVDSPKTLLDLWDTWVATLDLLPETKADKYRWLRVMLVKASPSLLDTDWLTKAKIAPATYRDRLCLIKACCKWAVSQGHLEANPYENLKTRPIKPQPIKPFTDQEIKSILEGFEKLYPHYLPFVRFLLATGVRTSEAIGLRWGQVDLRRGEIIISESLPKDRNGNGYQRVRKSTKTGSIRHLSMSSTLKALLMALRPTKPDPEALVFTSPNGCPIDADNWRERQWAKVLKHCQIPYRKPYTTRHTMASHAIEQGVPITGLAYLMGHSTPKMVMSTYGHMINRPELPDMPI
uniref:site-specific integrase n=1 Tax=Trichocoleus desertorum TaxID=1481672 RepID=UPI0025B62499|nr:site-specific integrase [Trichocoleus desertorum]